MISQTRYVNIVSGVGAGVGVAARQMILRLITQNQLVPPGVVFNFSSSDDVGAIFGLQSEEYLRSVPYFSFISKNITSPTQLSFSRWVNSSIPAMIVGDTVEKTLSQFTGITIGTMTLVSNGTSNVFGPLNFSGAANLTAVATIIQTALRLSLDPQLAATSTVTYNTNTNQFVLSGAVSGSGTLSASVTGLPTDVSTLLGWSTGGTISVTGQTADTALQAVTKSVSVSNNFATVAFCTPAIPLTNDAITSIAQYIDAQNTNYVYSFATLPSNLQTVFPLIQGYSGVAINVLSATLANDYVEQNPAAIAAATNYESAANSTQDFMFYQFPNENVTADIDALANVYDASRGNYIGITQFNGQSLAFYQRGVLCGGATAATDMNTFYNEIWLKSRISANVINLFLNSSIVPATASGAAAILLVIQDAVDVAKTNGTISAGKPLNVIQQQFITSLTTDPNAWRQVQNIGYWLTVTFAQVENPNSLLLEWRANYILIYSKNDAIRSVTGSDVLI